MSIKTILLFTTIPASAIRPSMDITTPKGLSVKKSNKNIPPVDKMIADIVTIVCHAELNWIIKTIDINTREKTRDCPRKACVSLISSSSPAKFTLTLFGKVTFSISLLSFSIKNGACIPSFTFASIDRSLFPSKREMVPPFFSGVSSANTDNGTYLPSDVGTRNS